MTVSEYKKKWVAEHREQVNATARNNQRAAREKARLLKQEQLMGAKEDEPVQIKICSSCGYIGPEKDFRKITSTCLSCRHSLRRIRGRINRDKIAIQNHEQYVKNKAARDAYGKVWQQANPEAFAEYKRRRRMRKSGNGGSFTRYEWEALKSQHDYACLCCGKKEPEIKLEADHIVPVVKGGNGFITNIQPLCGHCNNAKHIKIIDYRFTHQVGKG